MPPCFNFSCEECGFETQQYPSWKGHLLSEGHQVNARARSHTWTERARQKAIVVFGVAEVSKVHLMRHFGSITFVTDFVFWSERPDFCIIQFLTQSFYTNFLTKKHAINGAPLFLRRREEINELEWKSICVFAPPVPRIEDLSSNEEMKNEINNEQEPQPQEPMQLDEAVPEAEAGKISEVGNDQPPVEPVTLNRFDDQNEMWDEPPPAPVETQKKKSKPTALMSPSEPAKIEHAFSNEEIRAAHYNYKQYERPVPDADLEMWNFQMNALYERNLMPVEDWTFRMHVIKRLEQLIKQQYSYCVLIPFGAGSAAISSARERETFHIFADLAGNTKRTAYTNEPIFMDINPVTRGEMKKSLVRLLTTNKDFIFNVEHKPDNRPSHLVEADEVLFTYRENEDSLNCRIQTQNFLAVQSCRVISFVCKLDNRVRSMLILARNWSYHNHLVQSNHGPTGEKIEYFTVATIQWLVIYFLSMKKIIPSVSTLQKYAAVPLIHCGVNLAVCCDANIIQWKKKYDYEADPERGNPSARCILGLFQEMLKYFEAANLKQNILCVNLGVKLPKNRSTFKKEHNRYFKDPTAIAASETLYCKSTISVQHPLKLDINLSKNVTERVGALFKYACAETAHKLEFLLNGALQNCNPVELFLPLPLSSVSGDFTLPEFNPTIGSCEPNQPEEPNQNDWEISSASSGGSSKVLNAGKSRKYQMELPILASFRRKIEGLGRSRHPITKILESNSLIAVWLEMLRSFNEVVWPICFGVHMIPRLEYTKDMLLQEKLMCLPFHGSLVDPEKLKWLKHNSIKEKTFLTQKIGDFMCMLKRSRRGDSSRSICSKPVVLHPFEFDCKLTLNMSEHSSLKHGSVFMSFTNVIDSNIYNINYLTRTYALLWKSYSQKEISTLNNNFHLSEEVAQLFN